MPVTELANFPLATPLPANTPLPSALHQKLLHAKQVLEAAAGYKFYFYRQIEDPSVFYILGRWSSVAAHASFLLSPENQVLLDMLTDDIDGEKMTMYHLDIDIFDVLEGGKCVVGVEGAEVVSLNRHFIQTEKKNGFQGTFDGVKGLLENYTEPWQVAGGWRIEKEAEGKEEWVLFSGFESVEQHEGFAKTEEFGRYKGIVGFVEGFELKHLKRVEGL
jgi:heme-degrading monooxygenase HmoA